MISVGGMFSGIGGLERAVESVLDSELVWQCERDDWRRWLLEREFGPCQYDDVLDMEVHDLTCDMDVDCFCGRGVQPVDMIVGGFPCQDVATNGKRAGLEGARSGLFFEIIRAAMIIRPSFIFLENVPGLRNRGLDRVLAELAAAGYDAEWTIVRADKTAGALIWGARWFVLARRNRGSVCELEPMPRTWPEAPADMSPEVRAARWAEIVGWPQPSPVIEGADRDRSRMLLAAAGDSVCWPQAAEALRILIDRYRARDDAGRLLGEAPEIRRGPTQLSWATGEEIDLAEGDVLGPLPEKLPQRGSMRRGQVSAVKAAPDRFKAARGAGFWARPTKADRTVPWIRKEGSNPGKGLAEYAFERAGVEPTMVNGRRDWAGRQLNPRLSQWLMAHPESIFDG